MLWSFKATAGPQFIKINLIFRLRISCAASKVSLFLSDLVVMLMLCSHQTVVRQMNWLSWSVSEAKSHQWVQVRLQWWLRWWSPQLSSSWPLAQPFTSDGFLTSIATFAAQLPESSISLLRCSEARHQGLHFHQTWCGGIYLQCSKQNQIDGYLPCADIHVWVHGDEIVIYQLSHKSDGSLSGQLCDQQLVDCWNHHDTFFHATIVSYLKHRLVEQHCFGVEILCVPLNRTIEKPWEREWIAE